MKLVLLAVVLLGGCAAENTAAGSSMVPAEAAPTSPTPATSTPSGTTWGSAGTATPGTMATPATTASPPPSAAGAPASASCDVLQVCCGALVDTTLRGTCEAVAKSGADSACAGVTGMLCSSSSTTSAPQADCSALASCCARLDEEDAEDCQAAVDAADAAMCGATLAKLCPAPPGVPSKPGDACAQLELCCATLDEDDAEDCGDVIADADAAMCGATLAELCPSSMTTTPGAPGDACAQLELCCTTLDEEDAEDCQAAVDAADAAMCGATLAKLCPAPPGVPSKPGDACAQLELCCATLDEDDAEDCGDLIADADAAACSGALVELCPDPNVPTPPEDD